PDAGHFPEAPRAQPELETRLPARGRSRVPARVWDVSIPPTAGPVVAKDKPARRAFPRSVRTASLGRAAAVVASVVFLGLLTLWVLGVRDWRCYGIVFLWPPFLAAVKTGNITALLGLSAALTWRFRDRASVAGASVGVSLAAKLLLWPLLVWLGATRRWRAALLSVAFAVGLLALSWAVIGFAGLLDYPDLLRRLQDVEAPQSYTLYALGLDLGAPGWLARAMWAMLAMGLLVGCVVVARR